MMKAPRYRIAVVIPCFRVRAQILDVLTRIGSECWRIYIVDDACPEKTGLFVTESIKDPRIKVLFHEKNQGVGGAVLTGYRQAVADRAQIIVKIDGDGQHDPSLIPEFCAPLFRGEADYTKGNRFYDIENLDTMPGIRIFGNAVLSLFSKLSTGYWDIFDPTNGYTAIRAEIAGQLPFGKISKRYFFESDMLFRLNLLHAVVVDIPMSARYAGEKSNLKINGIIGEFLLKHTRNLGKRIFYNYFLRDMSLASLELIAGVGLIGFGSLFGLARWIFASDAGVTTPAGTVMLAALPIMLGLQFLLAFIGFDIASVPRRPRSSPLKHTPDEHH